MATWKEQPAWLKNFGGLLPDDLRTPEEAAAFEAANYLAASGSVLPGNGGRKIRIEVSGKGDFFEVKKEESGYLVSGGSPGILYGTYYVIGELESGAIPEEGPHRPDTDLRMIDCWDNMDGSIERGYSGRSLWFEDGKFSYEPERIRQLARMLASVGINRICINNVNVRMPAQELTGDLLPDLKQFAAIFRPFGIRLLCSIDFSRPLSAGIGTADPLDPDVRRWWEMTARKVWEAIPDFAGFVVKADSEHNPGPNDYGRTHADGANMLADAVKPYGGILVWRAFVYNCMQDWRDASTDRPCAAYATYQPLDGAFHDNVILQVKHGPYDFQVREPLSPILLSMRHTNLALELQLAQEYTGQQVDLYAMPHMWKEITDDLNDHLPGAAAAVSNLGRDANWTGHPFAALNLFAFGVYAWDMKADPDKTIRKWIRLTYDLPRAEEEVLHLVLKRSRGIYEKYTAPLGLCWMVNPGHHYGPSPLGYEFQAWGTYNRADRDAVGIDRTADGTGYVLQYPEPERKMYEDTQTCPENLILFFHRLPYTYRMRDGRTLIQRIYDDHFEGYEEVLEMEGVLKMLPLPGPDAEEVKKRIALQAENAREWRDVTNTFFHRLSGIEDEKGRKIWP